MLLNEDKVRRRAKEIAGEYTTIDGALAAEDVYTEARTITSAELKQFADGLHYARDGASRDDQPCEECHDQAVRGFQNLGFIVVEEDR